MDSRWARVPVAAAERSAAAVAADDEEVEEEEASLAASARAAAGPPDAADSAWSCLSSPAKPNAFEGIPAGGGGAAADVANAECA